MCDRNGCFYFVFFLFFVNTAFARTPSITLLLLFLFLLLLSLVVVVVSVLYLSMAMTVDPASLLHLEKNYSTHALLYAHFFFFFALDAAAKQGTRDGGTHHGASHQPSLPTAGPKPRKRPDNSAEGC